jgi:hypothetical protein
MALSKATVCSRLSALGWSQQQVHEMVDLLTLWSKSSGEEWVVKRLKTLKAALIQHLAGNELGLEPREFALRVDGTPKGPFGPLFRSTRTLKERTRALNTLLAYSGYSSSEVTSEQWLKFASSVETPTEMRAGTTGRINYHLQDLFSRSTDLDGYMEFKRGLGFPGPMSAKPQPVTLDAAFFSETRRAPYYCPQSNRLRTTPETDVERWGPSALSVVLKLDLALQHGVFPGVLPSVYDGLSREVLIRSDPLDLPVWWGKVSFLQEPGYKLRAVANPNRWVQLGLDPLKRVLFSALRTRTHGLSGRDCTFDQEGGVKRVQSWLRAGSHCHSVDLSDATNQFPLSLQLDVIRYLLPDDWEPWICLWKQASEGAWQVFDPEKGHVRDMFWAKGQPLGLGPSFAAFALAHHYIASRCIRGRDDYVLLGDDIVIRGDESHDRYRTALRDLGCPVSELKCVSSTRLAEFAGKVITPEHVVPLSKWKEPTQRNFLDLLKILGPRYLGALPLRQRRVAGVLAVIPVHLGGLGWNPGNLSLEATYRKYTSIIDQLQSDALQPYEKSVSVLKHWALFSGSTTPSLEAHPGHGPEKQVSTSREGLIETLGVVRESFREGEDPPRGFRPVIGPGGDPRGPSTLTTMEQKLKNVLEQYLSQRGPTKAEVPSFTGDVVEQKFTQSVDVSGLAL